MDSGHLAPTATREEAIKQRDKYAYHWMIEEFHRFKKVDVWERGRRY
ncbi:MAG: hypothetical protein LC104_09530 [Bacteroidales bacterium]|nr:hypothetical protein [Bacteroidales bacterium]